MRFIVTCVYKNRTSRRKRYYRKLRSLDFESFCEDILTSPLLQDQAVELNALVGSVLGPLIYLLYASLIADIIKFHKLQYYLYADDTQQYISFRTDCSYDLSLAKRRVECCVNDIDCWMVNNGLKLNQVKN